MDEHQNNCLASLLSSKTCGTGTNPTAQPQESPQAEEETGGFFPFYFPNFTKGKLRQGGSKVNPSSDESRQLMSFKGR